VSELSKAIAAFLADRARIRASTHTQIAYAQDLEKLNARLPAQTHDELALIDEFVLARALADLHQSGLAAKSLTRIASTWRSFFKSLCLSGGVTHNPAQGLRAPKVRRRLPDILDPDETAQLLEIPLDDPLALRDRAALELLYSSGLRLSELSALKWTDLDLDDATVRVLGKGAKFRIVPVGRQAISALTEWREQARGWPGFASDDVFLNGRGGRLSDRAIQLRMKVWAQRQGIWKRVHPHGLRHGFASHLLESSGNLRAVQELLGHANLSTTQIYTHLDFMSLARVYDQSHPRAKGGGPV